MADVGVKVEGLTELRKALKAVDAGLPKELGQVHRKLGDMVVTEAQARARGLGGVAAKSAPSLRAASQAARAQITLGGARAPYALGAEFGSGRYKQFKPWRGSDADAGYFLYPTIRANRDRITEEYERMLDELLNRAF